MNYVIDLQMHNIMSLFSEAYLKKKLVNYFHNYYFFFFPHFSILLFSLFLFQSTKEAQ